MRLLVLPQKFHDGEVHSVDVNLENALIATGGADRKVCVWRLEQFTDSIDKSPPDLTEIMPHTTLDMHLSVVSFVKWSPINPHEMISAGENGELVKSTLDVNKNEVIFPPESSKKFQMSSPLDGSWSIDGRMFVWSTANGAVHIYDGVKETHQFLIPHAKKLEEKKITLQRSVNFDPMGRYLVVIGDDTMVTVYQYEYDKENNYQFQVASRVSKLMSNSVTKSPGANYRRISWSCDGEFFAVPNASKQLASVVSLLSASLGWENSISLVGHDIECDLVKFAPHVFQRKIENDIDSNTPDPEILDYEVYHIIATAGSNSSLVLWNTTKEAPLSVMHDISSKPLVDLVWDKSGRFLFLTTLDGKIIVAGFAEGELGNSVSPEILNKFKATQKQVKKQTLNKTSNETMGTKKAKVPTEVVCQKEATELRAEEIVSDANDSFVSAEQDSFLGLHQNQISQPSEILPLVLASGIRFDSQPENSFIVSTVETNAEEGLVADTPKKQDESQRIKNPRSDPAPIITLKNGKKRIQPISLSNEKDSRDEKSEKFLSRNRMPTESIHAVMEFDKPSYIISEELTKDTKRPRVSDEGLARKKAKRELEPVKFIGTVVCNPNTTFSQVRLSVPKTRSAFRLSDTSHTLEIRNGLGNEDAPSRLTCFKEDSQVWCDFIPRFIQLATKGDSFWALCTADGTIHTYNSLSGKRLLPPIVLGSPISFLESKNQFLMAVTSIAEVYVWDIHKKKIHMKSPLSLAALLDLNTKLQENTLSKSDNITMCSITSKGLPITTISNGSGYIYNIDMEVWQTVTEAWWAFGSHYWDSITDEKAMIASGTAKTAGERGGSSIICLLEHKTNEELIKKSRTGRGKYFNKISKNMMMKEGFENLENTVSLSHLENRILCSEILGEQADFKDFLLIYSKRLCELGFHAKLFQMFESVLGDQDHLRNVSAETRLCGLDRQDLLKDILLACAEHRDVQKILVYFGNKIGLISRDYE